MVRRRPQRHREIFALAFRAKDALCINDTCVNEGRLKSLLGQSADAGAPASGAVVDEASGGSSAPVGASKDTATSTTPVEKETAATPENREEPKRRRLLRPKEKAMS